MRNLRTEDEIIANWKGDIDKPVVSICCITYNHEPYIEDALEGFLIQETDFPFEIVIRDDASKDSTAIIIKNYQKKYPKLIKPIYEKENGFKKGIEPVDVVINNSSGDYIAFCEGDDYWICKDKLQTQKNFLDKNNTYQFCWTRFKTLEQETGKFELDKNTKYFLSNLGAEFGVTEFCKTGWHIGMQTLMFKKNLRDKDYAQLPEYRDVFMLSDFLTKTNGFCLPEVCSVYRLHEGGIHSSVSEFERLKKAVSIYRKIATCFPNNSMYLYKYFEYSNSLILQYLKKREFGLIFEEIVERSSLQNYIKIFSNIVFFIFKNILRRLMLR